MFELKNINYPPEIEDLRHVHCRLRADRSSVLERLVAIGLALGEV